MTFKSSDIRSENFFPLLHSYFPDIDIDDKASVGEQIESENILTKPDQLLAYMQTAFFEEHLLELQCDHTTRRFFANILDYDPENDEEELENEYEAGSYLKASDSFIVNPLTPAIGNANIRSSNLVIIRFFMGTSAVELGCRFREEKNLRDMPVINLDFPIIGRVNRNYRPFRVKAVSGVDAKLSILSPKPDSQTIFELEDISTMGLAFQVPNEKIYFQTGEPVSLKIQVTGANDLEVSGLIRHTTKVRQMSGYRNICGVQFDLETRSLAAKIERLTASIQRLQLREMAEKVSFLRGVRIIK
jgi:PilZ domain